MWRRKLDYWIVFISESMSINGETSVRLSLHNVPKYLNKLVSLSSESGEAFKGYLVAFDPVSGSGILLSSPEKPIADRSNVPLVNNGLVLVPGKLTAILIIIKLRGGKTLIVFC